jgi:hypothetical protein
LVYRRESLKHLQVIGSSAVWSYLQRSIFRYLCCAAFCYVLLCYYSPLFCAALPLYFCSVLCSAVLSIAVLRCVVLFCVLLCYSVLCCALLECIVLLCSGVIYSLVLCSPCIKNTMDYSPPESMQVAFNFYGSQGDLSLFLPPVTLHFHPSAPLSFFWRNY